MKALLTLTLFLFSSFGQTVLAAETPTAEPSKDVKVRYKEGKAVDFEQLLIQGQLKRPDISVVTGDTQQGTDGLLRLREHFLDRVTADVGEENP